MTQGWNCPNCGKAHAPHVQTCPEPARMAAPAWPTYPSPKPYPTYIPGTFPWTVTSQTVAQPGPDGWQLHNDLQSAMADLASRQEPLGAEFSAAWASDIESLYEN